MNVKQIILSARRSLVKHSPEILTGVGIAGMIATTIMAVKATPKALKLIEEFKEERGYAIVDASIPKVEIVKVAWKPYLPAAITGVTSMACLVSANSVNARRNAALAAAYTISDTALKEYREKMIETIGEKKDKEIKDAIAKDKIDKHPVDMNDVIVTGTGNTLCYDAFCGRYFWSDVEKLKRSVNDLNEQLLTDGYVSLNDFYDLVNLDMTKKGDLLGWDSRKGQVRLSFSSQLARNSTPCLVLDFAVAPSYDYYH